MNDTIKMQASVTSYTEVSVQKKELFSVLRSYILKQVNVSEADYFIIPQNGKVRSVVDYGHHRGGESETEIETTDDQRVVIAALDTIGKYIK
mgnify:CR=1 FL=1